MPSPTWGIASGGGSGDFASRAIVPRPPELFEMASMPNINAGAGTPHRTLLKHRNPHIVMLALIE
eukprot:6172427-Pleurochrysis_carterae.AAC.3